MLSGARLNRSSRVQRVVPVAGGIRGRVWVECIMKPRPATAPLLHTPPPNTRFTRRHGDRTISLHFFIPCNLKLLSCTFLYRTVISVSRYYIPSDSNNGRVRKAYYYSFSFNPYINYSSKLFFHHLLGCVFLSAIIFLWPLQTF